ncbi:GATA transcription factor 15-like [Aristolochia californica]|uniref:GATA transcription factor 15-like n=1 Tax=Aristolochia californica TaxID=171875 RepID=UPI0035D98E6E
MDSNEKKSGSSAVDLDYPAAENQCSGIQKTCTDCNTTKTPLWRGGPAGPKSLCNACGIRYRKRRRALLGLNPGVEKEKEKKERKKNKLGVSYKLRLLALGRDVLLHRSLLHKQRKLAEEEEAAVLLMALSCGFVHA